MSGGKGELSGQKGMGLCPGRKRKGEIKAMLELGEEEKALSSNFYGFRRWENG